MSSLPTMKLCVTGAPGWLGSRLVEVLAEGFGDPRAPELPSVEALTLLVQPGLEPPAVRPAHTRVVYGDVRDARAVQKAVEGADVVLHLAAIIHPTWRGIDELMDINTGGTRTVLEAAIAAGCKRFVLMSSNSVAGTSTELGRPFREDDGVAPYMAYGRSKAAAEDLVAQAVAAGRIEGVSLRGCWYYGPHQAARQTRFFGMIARGNPVMFGEGQNLRSLTYVDHLVSALMLAATVPEANGRTYWIADARPYPTVHIYDAIADALGVPRPRPRKLPALVSRLCAVADGVLQRVGVYWTEVHVAGEMAEDIACTIDKARDELGYEPWVSLEEGMSRSVAWCRAQGHTFPRGE
ncbi:MAG: NAD(P)-dependent oxidoreductase [Deltaproteobacteria bacterium]|nr:NAD(P)-dependent oxidoreductase [Deltaproteobacteria bacterium]MCB9788386.1 NAD(P)-dependent oxidoreductase [Deltaproteobacteria bacterium]